MSERNGYEPGVPCWVGTVHPDAPAAASFYRELFGWETEPFSPPGAPPAFACTLRGRRVAAIGSLPEGAGQAAWITSVWVDDADAVFARATEAGGGGLAEPFEFLGMARFGVAADPAGAVFALWQPRQHRGAELVNEPGAWAMSTLHTPDSAAAERFYGAVFGWETDRFDAGGTEIGMFRVPGYVGGEPEQPVSREVVATVMPGNGGTPAHWRPDFWVHDADRAAGRAADLGGRVLAGPFDMPPGRTAILADPQGAAFSVSQLVKPGG